MPTLDHLGRFPPDHMDLAALVPSIVRAHAALARNDGLLAAVPNARLLFAPLTVQEAVLSSRIEGTQVTMGEVLEADADGDTAELSAGKRETHVLLMQGVRGQDTGPGDDRTDQN